MDFIPRLLLLLSLCYVAECTMCYFCADSTNANGKDKCQSWFKTMNYYRKRFIKDNTWSTDKYVKNCTNYGGQGDNLCMIASVEGAGNVKTFIRDCTDGNAFLDDEIDAPFKNNVVPNNKTTCHYIGTGFIACVTVCDPRTDGDFCNGPVTDSTTQCVPNIALLMSLIFAIFLCRNKLQ